LVNLALARDWGRRHGLAIADRGLAELLGPGRYRLGLKRGALLSLLAEAAKTRLTLSGVRYPLRRALLRPGGRGLSNVAQGPAALTVHAGRVWVMTADG
jgi:thiamine pyrophosphokinase